jgi:hypothetical protein
MFINYINKIITKLFRTVKNKTATLCASHGPQNEQQFFPKPNYLLGSFIGAAMVFLCGRNLLLYILCS